MISRYFHTVRYLKAKQIYYRIWFNLIKPTLNNVISSNIRITKNEFCFPIQKKICLIKENTFQFLNKTKSLSEVGWSGNSNTVTKLWRYNQHYFDDLNAIDSLKRNEWHDQLLKSWVSENSISRGVGWEPYPTSLRIINWIKYCLLGKKLSDICLQSLALQSKWLSKRIEWHILGNHLFTNAKALVFAGLFFSSKESEVWLKKGLKIINDQLEEQVLDDGGNFELSPMYHSIFLEDVLDLINISQLYPKFVQKTKVDEWIYISKKMITWLDLMTHPDGDIAFFNDAAFEIAPKLDELKKYAKRLGISYSSNKFKKITHLSDSGYIRFTSNNAIVLLDVASIGPDYMPGHAHADTLSFEFSLFGQRLLVNSGTSEYEVNPIRQYERSTKAHNTVVINDESSSEVWSAFRVARRAYPYDLKIEELANSVNISCAHDGYKRLENSPIHRRGWKFFENSLTINDYIDGSFKNAYAYFHFHPSIAIKKRNNSSFEIKMSNGQQVILWIKIGEPTIETSYYAPEFGKKLNSKCLKVALDKKEGACVKISWNNINE